MKFVGCFILRLRQSGQAGRLLSLCYQGLRTLLLPQCFQAISQRKMRPEGCCASN